MISLIICSREPDISQTLKDNIAATVGVEYELVVIDNSTNSYSIFSAYNEGERRAKYPYLCFMHEDILYHTSSWGTEILRILNDNKIGLLGVMGGKYLPHYPSTWFSTKYTIGRLLQGQIGPNNQYLLEEDYRGFFIDDIQEVVAVDGLWFCIRKELFGSIKFDSDTYDGWHAYDIDICMQIRKMRYIIVVTSKILIEHKSLGNTDKYFYISLIKFFLKWKHYLPVSTGILLSKDEIAEVEKVARNKFFYSFKRSFGIYNKFKKLQNFLRKRNV